MCQLALICCNATKNLCKLYNKTTPAPQNKPEQNKQTNKLHKRNTFKIWCQIPNTNSSQSDCSKVGHRVLIISPLQIRGVASIGIVFYARLQRSSRDTRRPEHDVTIILFFFLLSSSSCSCFSSCHRLQEKIMEKRVRQRFLGILFSILSH